MNGADYEQDIEKIRLLIEEKNHRFAARGGSVALAGIDGGTVSIAPSGFCWR